MYYTTLSESMEVEDGLSAGVNIGRNSNLVGALCTNSYAGDDIIENVIRNNTDEENDNENAKSAGVNDDSSENRSDDECTGVRDMLVDTQDTIETVTASKKRFSKRDQLKAETVRRFQHVAGVPSDATIFHSVTTNRIKNNTLTRRDVIITNEMLRQSKYAAQGKTK